MLSLFFVFCSESNGKNIDSTHIITNASIDTSKDANTTNNMGDQIFKSPSVMLSIKGEGVNIRKTPSIDASILTQLNTGDTVTLINQKWEQKRIDFYVGNWLEIELENGITGWVFSPFVQPKFKQVSGMVYEVWYREDLESLIAQPLIHIEQGNIVTNSAYMSESEKDTDVIIKLFNDLAKEIKHLTLIDDNGTAVGTMNHLEGYVQDGCMLVFTFKGKPNGFDLSRLRASAGYSGRLLALSGDLKPANTPLFNPYKPTNPPEIQHALIANRQFAELKLNKQSPFRSEDCIHTNNRFVDFFRDEMPDAIGHCVVVKEEENSDPEQLFNFHIATLRNGVFHSRINYSLSNTIPLDMQERAQFVGVTDINEDDILEVWIRQIGYEWYYFSVYFLTSDHAFGPVYRGGGSGC